MGLLSFDTIDTLDYKESRRYQAKLKKIGLIQFLNLFKKNFEEIKQYPKFSKFGFEIEGHLLKDINLGNPTVGKNFQLNLDTNYMKNHKLKDFQIVHEFGAWMLELIPSKPLEDFTYSGNLHHIVHHIYQNMRNLVKKGDYYLSTAMPPKFGTVDYVRYLEPGLTSEQLIERNKACRSEYMLDEFINQHPRFPTFSRNVRVRRGEKPQISAPIFQDKNTNMIDVLPSEKKAGEIHLDAFAFGMGLCSLQLTFGVSDLTEARWLYDQFHVFGPIFVVLVHIRWHSLPRCHS